MLHRSQPHQKILSRSGITYCLAISADGKLLACTSNGPSITISRLDNDKPVATLTGDTAGVYEAAFLHDDQWIAATGVDGTLKIWNIKTGELIHDINAHEGPAFTLAVSSDRKQLATAGVDRVIRLWDAETGKIQSELRGHEGLVHCARYFNHSNSLVSCGFDGSVRIWDLKDKKLVKTVATELKEIWSLALAPDDKTLAVAGVLRNEGAMASVSVQPIDLYNLPGLDNARQLNGHVQDVLCVAFSEDGKLLASGARDGAVKIWDVVTGLEKESYAGTSLIRSLAFMPNNESLLAGGNRSKVVVWDLTSARSAMKVRAHSARIVCVDYSPDGKLIATGSEDGEVSAARPKNQ